MTRQHFASYYRWLVATQILQLDLGGERILDVGCADASFLLHSLATVKLGVDLQPRSASLSINTCRRATRATGMDALPIGHNRDRPLPNVKL